MTSGKQRDQHLLDHFVLADDDLTDLAQHGVAPAGKFFDLGDLVLLNLRCFHGFSSFCSAYLPVTSLSKVSLACWAFSGSPSAL